MTQQQLKDAKIVLEPVQEHPIGSLITTSGRVAFDDLHVAHVFSPVTGRVTKIVAELGAHVKKGEPLAIIDSPDLGMASADLQKAYADLVAAEHDFDRQKAMLAIRAVAQKDVETAEDNYRKAKAEVARAKQKASLLRVGADSVSQGYVLTSLIDGEVVNRSISPGMEVQGQYSGGTAAELFTVGETNPVWVLADAYEMDLARIHVGAKVHIKVVAFAEPFDGTVDWVSASLDPQTRTAKVRCTVKNPDHKLRPEMFATATIETDGRSALAIPRRAVVHLGDQAVVFVQRGDTNDGKLRFERVPVTVDEDEVGHLVAVQHGLAPGDVIVVSGAILLAG